MWYETLFEELEKSENKSTAAAMSAYMKNLFPFLGIQSAARRKIANRYFKLVRGEKHIDWEFVKICWEKPYREAQYIASDYVLSKQKYLTDADIPQLKMLLTTKSWWDTVDILSKLFGTLSLSYPHVSDMMIKWSTDENMWLRRTAILHQLGLKEKTDTGLLLKILCNNFGTEEFFINKAIGWSLREYSKTDPAWVRGFIAKYEYKLSKLSIKEGSKYI
jgi:3-methyladenine DNA glycosylase AlkD